MVDWSKYPSQAPTYKAWRGMMNRCYTLTNKDYLTVGGAGIRVCAAWHTFANFERDMGVRPDNSFLQRRDERADFCPENVLWAQKIHTRRDPLYAIWKGIRRRCGVIGSARSGSQSRYVDRGISIDPLWADSFVAFAADVGARPSVDHQLDRIDNDRGYEPGNVRWVLRKQNANNRSDNIWIEQYGARRTLQEWCDHYNIDRTVVTSRWEGLFKPAKPKNQCVEQLTLDGTVLGWFTGVKAAAEFSGVKQGTIAKCLSGGNDSAGGYRWRYMAD